MPGFTLLIGAWVLVGVAVYVRVLGDLLQKMTSPMAHVGVALVSSGLLAPGFAPAKDGAIPMPAAIGAALSVGPESGLLRANALSWLTTAFILVIASYLYRRWRARRNNPKNPFA